MRGAGTLLAGMATRHTANSRKESRSMMTSATADAPTRSKTAQVHVQRFGAFLTGMIMPNLPAFVAWGLITSFFIATGWLPSGILGGFGNADLIGWQGAATQLAMAPHNHTFPQYIGLV